MRRLALGCLLLAACAQHKIVSVPDTDEGQACTAQCMDRYHECVTGTDRDTCIGRRNECLIICPGAKLVDDPNY